MPATLEMRRSSQTARRIDPSPAVEAALREATDVLRSLGSSADGLTRVQAMARRAREGLNEIASDQAPGWHVQLFRAFQVPFNYLLLALALVALFTGDSTAGAIIAVMVVLSGLLRFWEEFRSGKAAEKLRALVRTTATVSRPDYRTEVPPEVQAAFELQPRPLSPRQEERPLRDLVRGDVVHLSAGDLVPADVRLLTAKDLFVTQATLTGESLPVEKADQSASEAREFLDRGHSPLELGNVCFMGTTVVSGTARAVVVATAGKTYLGSLARQVTRQRGATAFDKGVRDVSWLLIRFMLVMVPVIFVINGLTKHDWAQAALFGLAVAVGLTPEMLPMIVTANLARGAVSMARRKVIVKKLPSIQNFGAMDVLCTDKTGTLTQDKVALIQHINVEGDECDEVFEYAYLNSYFQTGLKNLLDRAVLEHDDLIQSRGVAHRYIKCDEVPFDFHRRRMSVVVHEAFRGRDLLVCKGAVEEVLAVSTQVRIGRRDIEMTELLRERARGLCRKLNENGLRVIAVAVRQLASAAGRQYGVADEEGLTLIGFVAFLDPPKESAAAALEALARQGVTVKILTGDNELVARKICAEVGLVRPQTLLGHQVEAMSDRDLEDAAEETVLFAKLSPPQKARIIAALKRREHTVGFLGDGINDAPALREADVGVSVDTAVDIARESADIILLEKSLLVLEEGILLGRQTYGNTIKYIKMAASSNFGNAFSVLIASLWLPFLPMLAIQLLLQNLLYDISQVGIVYDRMDGEYLEKPRKWQVRDLGRFMLSMGPISSIFDLTTFGVLYFVFSANSPERQSLFQAGWFIEGLLSQTLIIHMIRTAKLPFLQSVAAAPLMLLTLGVMATGIAIPFTPLGAAVGMAPLPATYFGWLAATLLGYCLLTHAMKRWYIRRFGGWL